MDDILNYILSNTHPEDFVKAITQYNVQSLYERHRNYLVSQYYNGHVTKWAVAMADLFSQFQDNANAFRCKELEEEVYKTKRLISLDRREKRNPSIRIQKYNQLVDELNNKRAGINRLIKLYKNIKNNERKTINRGRD